MKYKLVGSQFTQEVRKSVPSWVSEEIKHNDEIETPLEDEIVWYKDI